MPLTALVFGDAFRFNARISYRASPKINVYVRGENLGDDKTPDFFGLDYPGTAVYGGVEVKL